MKKIVKWTGITIGSLLVLLIVFFVVVYFNTEARANKIYDVKLQSLSIPEDSASYALGAHIAAIRGCDGCHAGGGLAFFDEKNPIALLHTANLTSGKGGIHYSDSDWIRALRHGVGKDGKSFWFMPIQHSSAGLSNQELGALIAYLKKLPPVNNVHPQKTMKPLGRILTYLNKFPMFPAEIVDHKAVFPDTIKPASTAAYGKYLVVTCQGCHGDGFKGGPAHAENEPPIPDISSTGHVGRWTSSQFLNTFHTGKTPEGKSLSSGMPWNPIGEACTDQELTALYLYLHDLK